MALAYFRSCDTTYSEIIPNRDELSIKNITPARRNAFPLQELLQLRKQPIFTRNNGKDIKISKFLSAHFIAVQADDGKTNVQCACEKYDISDKYLH